METEIEAKFLDIDPDALRIKLKDLGARLVHPERLMKRRIFDFPDLRLDRNGSWLRLRDEGNQVTLSFKHWTRHAIDGIQEVSITVSDFLQAENILRAIGLEEKSYQETKRETWMLELAEIVIDTWPWLPPFVEVEAPSQEEVGATASNLGLDFNSALFGGVIGVYQRYYDVNREEIDRCSAITFSPVPDWLAARRRT